MGILSIFQPGSRIGFKYGGKSFEYGANKEGIVGMAVEYAKTANSLDKEGPEKIVLMGSMSLEDTLRTLREKADEFGRLSDFSSTMEEDQVYRGIQASGTRKIFKEEDEDFSYAENSARFLIDLYSELQPVEKD